jgi:hypothetical protein
MQTVFPLIFHFQVAPTPMKQTVNLLSLFGSKTSVMQKKFQKTGVSLRSCERYASSLRKNGKIPSIHRAGRPQKSSPEQCCQIGMIIKHDHFTTSND